MRQLADGRGLAKVPALVREIADGAITDLSDWDEEELIRGMRRDRGGRFRGRPPKLVPAECLRELNRRRFRNATDLLAASLVDGARELGKIITAPETSTPDRIRSIELLFDRVLGKPRESIALDLTNDGEPLWKKLMNAAITDVNALKHHRGIVPSDAEEIVDGEVVEEPVDPDADADE